MSKMPIEVKIFLDKDHFWNQIFSSTVSLWLCDFFVRIYDFVRPWKILIFFAERKIFFTKKKLTNFLINMFMNVHYKFKKLAWVVWEKNKAPIKKIQI